MILGSFLLFMFTIIESFSFQPKPRIDYILKAVGGSLTAIPGLSDMIDVSIEQV